MPLLRYQSATPSKLAAAPCWGHAFIHWWHAQLGLTTFPAPWYAEREAEEHQELREATRAVDRLSETADIFYLRTRARQNGHPVAVPPFLPPYHLLVYAYMLAKHTSRWCFYRTAGWLCRKKGKGYAPVREVVNPAKDFKLRRVAARHDVDDDEFVAVCIRLRRFWPLLP